MSIVSIIIPTYNSARFLGAAIESVLRQTYSDYEIIVVDDGATDDTYAVLDYYKYLYKVVLQANSGVKAGFLHAHGAVVI